MKTAFICQTCGVQYSPSEKPPANCIICDDDRQYVGHSGQKWLTYPEIKSTHHNVIQLHEPGLYGIGIAPRLAIGQRALLVPTDAGNFLWDCVPLLDETTFKFVQEMGGLEGIVLSHPHYYSCIVEWSQAFGGIPIYIHEADRQWVTRPDATINFWSGSEMQLATGTTVINCGGHFPGSTVMHWGAGAEGRGCLFTGDSIYVVADKRYVSFMHSFPNLIPLPAGAVQRIVDSVTNYEFDRIYSAWFDSVLPHDARANLEFCAERYIDAINAI